MPLYEYKCSVCGRVSERRRSIAQRFDDVLCDGCRSDDTALVVSTPAVAQVRGGTGAQRYDAGKR